MYEGGGDGDLVICGDVTQGQAQQIGHQIAICLQKMAKWQNGEMTNR